MAEISCPVCQADVLLAGDERRGEEVFCTFCGSPLRLTTKRGSSEELDVEEDF